ncbi:enoyl-CoA hydratase/isomerase family protein [Streptomyces sp. NBC_00249]|uniref:(3,5-dihydroxyphenyl)acetyl-CoA 1,2-dioxygenase DpgC n=1 Tax=Streptomyces sp. NBC_00249 TaxID=2975690 RepID=UPI002252CAA9|nr:(3,5-dihydroxyphenyl)acetyl-CoA 1,2-dioxygenase DpgC [Streptomyces sp. NBC_00249]MCX5195628.1 enoyl-CoA hydratase/isomerase family protein [Streptomyces sp. NBC_00249]
MSEHISGRAKDPSAGHDRLPAAPAPLGDLTPDAEALARHTAEGERLLALLPPRPRRTEADAHRATALHDSCRAARHAFLARHADAVYDTLTAGRTRRPRLAELAAEAALRFPGLVPDAARLAEERERVQAHKEGREIDQGIFFGALLRSPTAGTHLIQTMLRPAPGSSAHLAEFHRRDRLELPAVLVERRGEAAHVTFRNAHCLNAEDNRLIADLETAVDVVLLDDRIRVGVLRGGPVTHPRHAGKRIFSAGINLKELRSGAISFVDFLLGRELGYVNKMARGLLGEGDGDGERAAPSGAVTKPWVGVVDAFAIGGGMQLLLVLDRVIAEEGAFLSLPAADEGIVPGLGNLRLTRLTGARLARQIILSGRRIHTDEPAAALLIDEVVPAAALDEAAERAVRDLAGPAVAANRAMLTLAEEPLDLLRGYLAEFAVVQAHRIHSPDVLAKAERHWARSRTAGDPSAEQPSAGERAPV